VAAVSAAARRLSDRAVQAAELDDRAAAVLKHERGLAAAAAELAEREAREIARAAELNERERALMQERAALDGQRSLILSRESLTAQLREELADEARRLEERAARLHWRWFLRAWSWRPPLLSRKARVCELFFVPSPHGYKLLDQTGLAVTPQSRITGLLEEGTSYVVTRITQWPLDGRWCAYLEITGIEGGASYD
jgi:hypothetical protein